MSYRSIAVGFEKIEPTSIQQDGVGNWLMYGIATLAVQSDPPDLNVTIDLEFRDAPTPLAAKKQVLENLLMIANQLSNHAQRELERLRQQTSGR